MDKGLIAKIISLLIFTTITGAVPTELKTSLSRQQLTVGEKINFVVSANVPKGAKLTPPIPENSFGKISVKGWDIVKTEYPSYDSISVQYAITTYIPESCTIPSLKYVLENGSTVDTLFTDNVPLEILSVINSSDSAAVDIKDIRAQQNTGKAPLWWLWLSLTAAGIIALIYGGILLSKYLRKPEKLPPPKPPYEEAIEALGILHGKRYLQQGLFREYVFELSEIFKRYIGRRFQVNAEEYTAEELIAWLGVSGLDMKIRHPVEWFFRTTDLVKFAKFTPDNATVDRFGKEVLNFLEITKPLPQQTAATEQTAESVTNQNGQASNQTDIVTSKPGENP